MGGPLPGAKEAMEWLVERGFCICIYSLKARTDNGRSTVVRWMEYYGIPYHSISYVKPDSVVYIDDRAIRHTDWDSTMRQLREQFGGLD